MAYCDYDRDANREFCLVAANTDGQGGRGFGMRLGAFTEGAMCFVAFTLG